MCASYKAQLLDGNVTMIKNYALTDDDLAAGYILTCQSHPQGDVTITYDLS
jgi:ring-1,2-phenylacetyl-CoA epoxidase subunit PaaE